MRIRSRIRFSGGWRTIGGVLVLLRSRLRSTPGLRAGGTKRNVAERRGLNAEGTEGTEHTAES